VGGGVVFGPRPRDYSYTIPRKLKQLAMKSILSLKVKEDRLKIVEDFSIASGKTKELVAVLKKLSSGEKTVIVLKDDDRMIKRAGANLPLVKFLSYNRLRAHDLFYGRTILMLESAATKLNEFYSGKKEEAPV
jgi:large subunit ribosomal protein L4